MIISSIMWDSCDAALLALTAAERWAAARRVYPRSAEEYSSIVAIALLLLALVVLLWWVSYRRNATPRVLKRDLFSDGAERKGLGSRERQILSAIVARSGLRRSHNVFTTPDAFDQGAAKLLEECAHSRTAQEKERLQAEVAGLREKLVYRVPTKKGEQAKLVSSRDIPVGAAVELLRRDDLEGPAMGAVVIRNDDLEVAVEMQVSVAVAAGEDWRVRYRLDGHTWQFDTCSVSCEDGRLVLNHGEPVHVGERDHPDHLVIHAPATVARFPFLQAAAMQPADAAPTDWFEPVRGVVTQVSDASLQIRSPLRVSVGERVLVVFALVPGGAEGETHEASRQGYIVGHVGRVERRQAAGEEMVMTVDLTGLAEREINELVRLAQTAGPGEGRPADARVTQGA
jgi:hypothetical protein